MVHNSLGYVHLEADNHRSEYTRRTMTFIMEWTAWNLQQEIFDFPEPGRGFLPLTGVNFDCQDGNESRILTLNEWQISGFSVQIKTGWDGGRGSRPGKVHCASGVSNKLGWLAAARDCLAALTMVRPTES